MKSREQIKLQIELAASVEEADKILEEEFPGSVEAKYAFLRGAYNFNVVFAENSCLDDAKQNYMPVLSALVNSKWRT